MTSVGCWLQQLRCSRIADITPILKPRHIPSCCSGPCSEWQAHSASYIWRSLYTTTLKRYAGGWDAHAHAAVHIREVCSGKFATLHPQDALTSLKEAGGLRGGDSSSDLSCMAVDMCVQVEHFLSLAEEAFEVTRLQKQVPKAWRVHDSLVVMLRLKSSSAASAEAPILDSGPDHADATGS